MGAVALQNGQDASSPLGVAIVKGDAGGVGRQIAGTQRRYGLVEREDAKAPQGRFQRRSEVRQCRLLRHERVPLGWHFVEQQRGQLAGCKKTKHIAESYSSPKRKMKSNDIYMKASAQHQSFIRPHSIHAITNHKDNKK